MVMVHQSDCQGDSDTHFEVNRKTRKKK